MRKLVLLIAMCVPLAAQDGPQLRIEFPPDAPVAMEAVDLGSAQGRTRSTSEIEPVTALLRLRNISTKTISGITLRVELAELGAASSASVSAVSLGAQPGEVFPFKLQLDTAHQFRVRSTPLPVLHVSLDCVLFSDLSEYGADYAHTRSELTLYELERRRERAYLTSLIAAGQLAEMREELNFGSPDATPGIRMRTVASITGARTRAAHVLNLPEAGLHLVSASFTGTAGEVGSIDATVRNEGSVPITAMRVGVLVTDSRRATFRIASVPVEVEAAPDAFAHVRIPLNVDIARNSGEPLNVQDVFVFLADATLADGSIWIPSRSAIDSTASVPAWHDSLAHSPEQQRLAAVFRRSGTTGVEADLKR